MRFIEHLPLVLLLGCTAPRPFDRAAPHCPPAPSHAVAEPVPKVHESRTVPPLDFAGAPTVQGEWSEVALPITGRTSLGGGGGSLWFRDKQSGNLLVIVDPTREPTVLALGEKARGVTAINDVGALAVIRRDGEIHRLVRADASGRMTQEIRLGWRNVEVAGAAMTIDGSLFALVTVRDRAQLGELVVVVPQHGQISALVTMDAHSKVTAVTPLEELLPGVADLSVSEDGSAWIMGRLRDSTAAFTVSKVQAGRHVFTRVLRWRDETQAYPFRSFHGPFASQMGASFLGDFSQLDWGEGPYRTEDDRSMMVIGLESSGGNVKSTVALPFEIETARMLGGRLVLEGQVSPGNYRILVLDAENGSVLFVTDLEKSAQCNEYFWQHLYSLADGSIGMFVECGDYDNSYPRERAREIGLLAKLGG